MSWCVRCTKAGFRLPYAASLRFANAAGKQLAFALTTDFALALTISPGCNP